MNNIQDNVSLLEWEILNSVDLNTLSKLSHNSNSVITYLYLGKPRYQTLLTNVQKKYSVLVTDDERDCKAYTSNLKSHNEI